MNLRRREFLMAGLGAGKALPAKATNIPVAIVVDPDDPVASAGPARWAVGELTAALAMSGREAKVCAKIAEAPAGASCIVASGPVTGLRLADSPEALALAPVRIGGRAALRAAGRDSRGLVYALLELADRVRNGAPLEQKEPLSESPANRIRGIARCFTSDVEDKSWYHDRGMWPPYLGMLAAQRFNRFQLTLGIGYDFTREIRDCYFHFAYPFLLSVPGYDVRVSGVSEAERDHNLEMLRYISDETEARGLHFQLGLWTHAYEWTESPEAKYLVSGLTPANHAAYCRDALFGVLRACPAIRGITFRIHGESGVAEGSYDFWKTVFDGILRSGRRIEIDLHAKGMDGRMIDVAQSTGLPVRISPKFWAEHMGLPYHQASIRDLEMPPAGRQDSGFFALSGGSRRFMRYGYGDLLREGRKYGVLHRIWPGTQRVLLWGDPVFAAGYGRAFRFGGSDGVELLEPLSFKGRKGSGLPGGRCAYADASLAPRWDWEKYLYTYRLWGRALYNPEVRPETWRRYLRRQFGPGAASAEAALAAASRILPLVTTAHGASAANNNYWPEIYTNMPIVDENRRHPYGDTPAPKRFGWVSPFDPALFSRIDDFAAELLEGQPGAKYSPVEVAAWLDALAARAEEAMARAEAQSPPSAELRRLSADVAIESGLGRFFAAKLRAGVLYSIHERTGDRSALEEALHSYQAARAAWAALAARGKVYREDISFGYVKHLRGHWLDRLPAIDGDIADMEARRAAARDNPAARAAVAAVLRPAPPPVPGCRHTAPAGFRHGEAVAIELALDRPGQVLLHYRRVNQSEAYQAAEMKGPAKALRATIPAEYTQAPYALEYFFEVRQGGSARLYPGFSPNLDNQPYYVIAAFS